MRTVIALRRLAWLAPAVAVAACSGKKEPQQAAGSTMKPESGMAAMAPPPAPVTVQLASKARSHVTGTVTLTAKGDSTEVLVALKGIRKGLSYPSHIHEGTCAKEGKVIAPLASVRAMVGDSGSSTTMILTSTLDSARAKYGSLFEQSHFPNMHPAACGDLAAK